MAKQTGMLVSIFRSDYDCTFNKLHGKKMAVFMDCEGPFTPREDTPPVKLVKRNFGYGEYIHAEPVEPGFYAFGGTFIYTSDSRFSKISKYPIPLHDRDMSLEK